MTLQTFSFPFPETRFFKAGSFIYKFKIRGGSSFSKKNNMRTIYEDYSSAPLVEIQCGAEVIGGTCFSQEMEDIIRTILGNLDSLQPFSSTHFNVFPYKEQWEGLSKVMCKHGEKMLRAYPFTLIIYVEKNIQNGKQAEEELSPEKEMEQHFSVSEPQSKRRKSDSPLEEDILKDLIKDLVAETKVSMVCRLHVDNPHAEGQVKEDPGHVDKMKGTKGSDKPQLKSSGNMIRESGTPGEVQPGTEQDIGEEEGDNADSVSETPLRSGILPRLASRIFPFSLLFREP